MRLTVVVPVYNHAYITNKALQSLYSATADPNFCLILVDDGSTDDTWSCAQDYASKYPPERFQYHQFPENRGVTAAWNYGLTIASSIEAQYVAIVNNDVEFSQGWDEPLVKVLEDNPRIGVVSPYSTCGARLPADWPAGADRNLNPANYMGYMPLLGAAFMTRTSLFSEIGLFPPEMVIYFNDNWLAMACQAKGYECEYVRESYVHHYLCCTTARLNNPPIWARDGAAFNEVSARQGLSVLRPYLNRDGTRYVEPEKVAAE